MYQRLSRTGTLVALSWIWQIKVCDHQHYRIWPSGLRIDFTFTFVRSMIFDREDFTDSDLLSKREHKFVNSSAWTVLVRWFQLENGITPTTSSQAVGSNPYGESPHYSMQSLFLGQPWNFGIEDKCTPSNLFNLSTLTEDTIFKLLPTLARLYLLLSGK